MPKFIIHGGAPLEGTIKPKGSKNEALQVICATLLTEETITLHNIPAIQDVDHIIHLLTLLKVKVTPLGVGSYQFCAAHIEKGAIYRDDFQLTYKKVRGSILLLAPLLIRFHTVILPKPGGDRIGRRGLHAHIEGLTQLGATCTYNAIQETWQVTGKALKGKEVFMPEASVTGTANVIMASVLTQGKTTIYPAACEPHVQQLCHMLVAMGAHITGIGSNLLTIEGKPCLGGTTHTILSDMLEVGSFIGLATATRSNLTITDVPIALFTPVWHCFRKLGVQLETEENALHIPSQKAYAIPQAKDKQLPTLSDAIWPGIPTDIISIAIIVAIHASGHVLIQQRLFESRLFFVDALIEMGAQLVLCDPHRVHIVGLGHTHKLHSMRMYSSDIRAGIALLIAALAAEGTSIIENVEQIDRGYEQIDQRLNALGASIQRVER